MKGKMNYLRDRKILDCYGILNYPPKLNYGGRLLKDQYLIVVEYSRTVNLILELLHDIEFSLSS